MNLDIGRIAITLNGTSLLLGQGVADRLGGALCARLSSLKPGGGDLARLDLGVIDAPAHADAETITALIATRLTEWLSHEAGGTERRENP